MLLRYHPIDVLRVPHRDLSCRVEFDVCSVLEGPRRINAEVWRQCLRRTPVLRGGARVPIGALVDVRSQLCVSSVRVRAIQVYREEPEARDVARAVRVSIVAPCGAECRSVRVTDFVRPLFARVPIEGGVFGLPSRGAELLLLHE